jgi:hypothetical protein
MVDFPLSLGTPIDNTAVLSDAQSHSVESSDSTQVAPGPHVYVVNQGAFATWQYGSGPYTSRSGSLANGIPLFLPIVLSNYGH